MINAFKSLHGYIFSSSLFRFLVVGMFNSLVNYITFYELFVTHLYNYCVASAIGFMLGSMSGFFLNRNWTFSSSINLRKGIGFYLIVQIFSLIISILVLRFSVEFFDIKVLLAQILAIFLSANINFFLSRRYVFNDRP